jgi:hypothetical protein
MPAVTRSKAYAATAPCKIDFSKVKPRHVSDYFEFPKSTEQKLEEALAEIASLKKTKASLEKEFVEYKNAKTRVIADKICEVWEAKRKIKMLEAELKLHLTS